MRTLRLRPDPAPRRDPAPSRWHYRYQRLMLTPIFRATVRVGLPSFALVFAGGLWFSSEANRVQITTAVENLRAMIESRPEFMVSGMEIQGADIALASAISSSLDLSFPASSFDLDLAAIRSAVTDLTAVRDAVVRVRPGGTLLIEVDQRVPLAVWRYADGLRLIDADGVMTGMIAARSDRADLPLIAGDGARDSIGEALALFRAAAPIQDRVRGLVRMGARRWDLVLDRDQRILLPERNPVAALERVVALHEARDLLSRDVQVVDMRNEHRPTVRVGPMAVGSLARAGGGL